MFPAAMLHEAAQLLDAFRERGLRLVTAESCTGGLIAALLTELPGSSDVRRARLRRLLQCLQARVSRCFEYLDRRARRSERGRGARHGRRNPPTLPCRCCYLLYRHCRPRRWHRRQARRPRVSGCCPLRCSDICSRMPLRRHWPQPGPRKGGRGCPIPSQSRPDRLRDVSAGITHRSRLVRVRTTSLRRVNHRPRRRAPRTRGCNGGTRGRTGCQPASAS